MNKYVGEIKLRKIKIVTTDDLQIDISGGKIDFNAVKMEQEPMIKGVGYYLSSEKLYLSEYIRIKDNKRIQKLKDNGNDIIIVWETDYLKDKNKTLIEVFDKIQKIIQNKWK